MFKVVLVSPLHYGNIGSVCRAMANTGLHDLTVVAPRTNPEEEEDARKMACHAGEIFDSRRICDSFNEAIADCVAVVGTTVRAGLYRQHVTTPREVAAELIALSKRGNVALVFGREDNGLHNEEIARCTHLIRIPSHPDYASINLAQATMIVLYELYSASAEPCILPEKSPPVEASMRERLFEIWRETMLEIGFMKPDKADHMMQGFQRIFSRGVKTLDDANIMLGVARQAQWASRRKTNDKIVP